MEPAHHGAQTLSAFANDFHNLGGGYVIIGVAEDEDHSYFMVRLPVHPAALAAPHLLDTGEPPTQSGEPPTQSPTQSDEPPTQSPTQSDDPIERILVLLEAGEQSAGELRQALGIKHRPTFRERYLHPAMQQGLIEYTLPDRPGSRLQKYRLTERGRQALAG